MLVNKQEAVIIHRSYPASVNEDIAQSYAVIAWAKRGKNPY